MGNRGRVVQIAARDEAESSSRATVIVVCGQGEVVVIKEQGWLRMSHGLSVQPLSNRRAITFRITTRSHGHLTRGTNQLTITRQSTNSPRSLTAMATLQQKGSIISRTSFAALEVEEPESEEELEVVEISPVE